MKKASILFFILLALGASSLAQRKLGPFKTGDRIVFAGNSITEAGLYESYIWLYYMTHFPDRPITVFNGGVGSDVSEQIYRRLDGDLLPKKPSVLVISFGMNDSKYFEYNDPKNPVTETRRKAFVNESYQGYLKIQSKLKSLPNIEKIIMASSPYDATVKQSGVIFVGKVKTMKEIVEFQKKAAKKQHWGFVDLFHPMTAINERGQKKDPAYTCIGPGRVHPGSAGHLIMAYLFLKNQGLANHPVATMKINAKSGKMMQVENCTINNLNLGKGEISFDYLAKSLPYPMDTVARIWENKQIETDALKVIPFMKEFDNESLQVTGLKGNSFLLSIDNIPIGNFTSRALAKGINLATFHNTPEYHQALEIMDLNSKRKNIEAKFRNYYWVQYDFLYGKGLLFNTTQVATDTIKANLESNGWLKVKYGDYEEVRTNRAGLKNQMRQLVAKIYAINKPVKHRIELIKQN